MIQRGTRDDAPAADDSGGVDYQVEGAAAAVIAEEVPGILGIPGADVKARNIVAGLGERAGEVAADEPGAPRDKNADVSSLRS